MQIETGAALLSGTLVLAHQTARSHILEIFHTDKFSADVICFGEGIIKPRYHHQPPLS